MEIAEFRDFTGGGSPGIKHRRSEAVHKDFPPPITWLAPTHMPCEMKKLSTSDGRLVIKEVKRCEYFLADRSNGRLVLNLIHVNDHEYYCDAEEEEEEEESDGGDEEEVTPECYKYNGVGCGGFVATAPLFIPPVPI